MLEMVLALVSGLIGIAIGWLMRAPNAQTSTSSPIAEESLGKSIDYGEVAQRIRDLTHQVAADVDLHQDRVRAADDVLRESVSTLEAPQALMEAIASIVDANRDMQQQLGDARNKLEAQAEELQSARQHAMTDPLTHLHNRRALDAHLESRYQLRSQPAHPTCIALFDVDHFKQFNDTYGHQAGDQVLRKVASVLHARLHQYGLAARFGGEEFAVVLDDQTAQQMVPAIEAVRSEISKREIEYDGVRMRVTVSCGLSQLDSTDSLEQWVERADEGLYRAKHDGRNRGYLNDNGEMIPLATSTSAKEPAAIDNGQEKALELLKVGEELHLSLSKRKIPVTAVVMVIEGSQTVADEIERQVRLQARGIDRLGRLGTHEIGMWMPSTNVGAAKEWLSRFSMQMGRNDTLRSDRSAKISAGCAAAEVDQSFASAVQAARKNVSPI